MAGLVNIDLGQIFGLGEKILDKIFPDPAAKADALLKLKQLEQSGELAKLAAETDLLKGQLDINKIEAASSSTFVNGWRPAIGWICAVSLAAYYPPRFLVSTGLWLYDVLHNGAWINPPDVGITEVLGLLGSILGIGWMRTYEKAKGITTNEPGH